MRQLENFWQVVSMKLEKRRSYSQLPFLGKQREVGFFFLKPLLKNSRAICVTFKNFCKLRCYLKRPWLSSLFWPCKVNSTSCDYRTTIFQSRTLLKYKKKKHMENNKTLITMYRLWTEVNHYVLIASIASSESSSNLLNKK